jgi:hypothetical protein
MPAMMTVRYDGAAVRSLQRMAAGVRGGLTSIVPPAINRVTSWSRTRMKREIAAQARIKARSADRLLRTEKATRLQWSGSVAIQNRRIPIGKFLTGRSRTAPVLAAFPSGLGRRYPHAFRAVMPSGHRGAFVRARTVKPAAGVRRPFRIGPAGRRYRTELPIYEIRERIGEVLRMDWLAAVQRQGAERLRSEIVGRIQWRLSRQRGGR